MTDSKSPHTNADDAHILCPECGANIAAPVQLALADDPLYKKAKRIHLGFHRWHIAMKILSFFCLGFAVWINDFCDTAMRLLCTETIETVDMATHSAAWKWTVGWFVAPPPPTVTQRVLQVYDWYSYATTLLLIAGVIWLSRWFYWTSILDDFQSRRPKNDLGHAAFGSALLAIGLWMLEYAVLGFTARWFFGPRWPTPIFVLPTLTAWVAYGFVFATMIWLDVSNAPVQHAA